MRKIFAMTQEQLDRLLDACAPVPMIMLNCTPPRSQQENANTAWKRLGDEMGFDYMTVKPHGKDQKCFTAIEKENHGN